MKKTIIKLTSISVLLIVIWGCKKSFLDAKPDQSLVVPKTLADMQALLDNDQVMNGAGNIGAIPGLGEVASDSYYVLGSDYNIFALPDRNAYIWAKQVYAGTPVRDWDYPYRGVFYANVALDGLNNISVNSTNQSSYNNVKGSALFLRAFMYYHLAQVFAPAFNKNTAATDLGIPLRTVADINEKLTRATLQQTYDQITGDILKAIPLLPNTPLFKTRPSKTAAFALLARMYLSMQDYDHAYLFADSALQLQNNLIDYNSVNASAVFPFKRFNDECIFQCVIVPHGILSPGLARVDSGLYNTYQPNDLRKNLFFKAGGARGGHAFYGSYDGSAFEFGGLATDELYLIRAECAARKGNVTLAMADINTLLQMRSVAGTFQQLTAATPTDALSQILAERRKELVFRGLRWSDLRRLNTDPQYAVTISRNVQGQTYTLPPGDNRYVYPIPDDVIGFNPSMPQNPR